MASQWTTPPDLPESALQAGATHIGRTLTNAFAVEFKIDRSVSLSHPGYYGTAVFKALQDYFVPMGWELEWEGVQGYKIRLTPPKPKKEVMVEYPAGFDQELEEWLEEGDEEEDEEEFAWTVPGSSPLRTVSLPHPPIGVFEGCGCAYCIWVMMQKPSTSSSPTPQPGIRKPRVGDWLSMGVQYMRGGKEIPMAPTYTTWVPVYKVFSSEKEAVDSQSKRDLSMGLGFLTGLEKDLGAIVGPLTHEDVKPGIFEMFGTGLYMRIKHP